MDVLLLYLLGVLTYVLTYVLANCSSDCPYVLLTNYSGYILLQKSHPY